MIAAWWAVIAAAHPIGNRFVGHGLDVSLGADTVAVTYEAELPDALGSATDPKDAEALSRELASGLVLIADGRALPVERSKVSVQRGSEHTTRVSLTLTAHLDPGLHTLTVTNGNLPEIPAYYTTRVRLDPLWTAVSPDAPSGNWVRAESQRRLRIFLSRRDDLLARWWRAVGPPALDRIPLAAAGPSPALAPLHQRSGSPETAAVAVAMAGLLGATRTEPSRRRFSLAMAATVLGAGLLDPSTRSLVGALGAAGIALTAAIAPSWTPAAAILSMLAAQPLGLSSTCGFAVVTASFFALPRRPRLAVPLGIGTAVVLLARVV